MMSVAFPDSYVAGREAFRAGARRPGWTLETWPIDGRGPSGETLTVEVARSGPATPDRRLVVSSGLHGVEGAFGSAVQARLFDRWAAAPPPPDIGLVLLHALNPWGFAWGRRVDAANVDPNRSFLFDDAPVPATSPVYARLDPWLNPPSPPGPDLFVPRMLVSLARDGGPALRQALVAGQYDFPRGLFFGGRHGSATSRLLADRFAEWTGGPETILHLDLHTGLGRRGGHTLLVGADLSASDLATLHRWFGAGVVEQDDPQGTSYRAAGTFGAWCTRATSARRYLYACAEFGTYGALTMLRALRAENRAYLYGDAGESRTRVARAALRERFCPSSAAWRARVTADALALVDRGIAGLCGRESDILGLRPPEL